MPWVGLMNVLDQPIAIDHMAERLPHLEIVERRVLGVEEQVVGAEVAVVRVELLRQLGVSADDVVISRRQIRTAHKVDLAGLIGREIGAEAPRRSTTIFWMNGLLVPLYLGLAS